MNKYLFFLMFGFVNLLFFFSCNRKIEKNFLTKSDPIPEEYNLPSSKISASPRTKNVCKDKMNYIPDPEHLEYTPIKTIRVNFHIMRDSKGQGQFPDEAQGRVYVKRILASTNQKLRQNAKMFLPKRNNTPVLPQRYNFELTPLPDDPNDDGIYFHNDDDLYYMISSGKHTNLYRQDVYKKYGVQKDSVLNIFMMGMHPDSLLSKTYNKSMIGIAFGKWTKVASWWYLMKDKSWKTAEEIPFNDHWSSQRLLNHELGHCLGLSHSWGGDSCDDTPRHPNCWNYTHNGSSCDSLISNNIMDYNAHAGAWTPCQIGTVHKNLANKSYRIRPLLKRTWCHLDKSKTITIKKKEKITWLGAKDLEGNIIVKNGASLTIRCRVSIPPNGKIIVEPKGELMLDGAILENDCGKTWEGIEVWSVGKNRGKVILLNDAKIMNAVNPIEVTGG